MKNLSIVVSLMISSLLFIICSCSTSSSTSSGTPGDITKNLWKYIEKNDFDAILKMMDTGGKEMDEDYKGKLQALVEASSKEIENKGGIKSMEVVNEDIDEEGKTAEVELKITYGNGDIHNERANLVNVNGKWMFKMK